VARDLATLANGVGNFPRLAQAHAYFAILVTHHHQGAKTETAATLYDFGGSIDVNNLLHQLIQRLPVAAKLLLATWARTTRPASAEAAAPAAPTATEAAAEPATTAAVTGASYTTTTAGAGTRVTGRLLSFVCHSSYSPVG
jgi:hypothetical protein